MEPNDCCLWTEPRHFKYTLPSVNMCIYLNRSAYSRLLWREWLIQDSGLWIKPHQFKNIHITTCAFVWRGRQRSTCVCHYLWQERLFRLHAFIFLCRTNPWVKYPWNSFFFFDFERILYWFEIKAYFLKIYFYFLFLYFFFLPAVWDKCKCDWSSLVTDENFVNKFIEILSTILKKF